MGLRMGTAMLMTTAAVIVLTYLTLYLGGLTEDGAAWVQSSPCFVSGC
jgi:hypothetical protein